MSLYKIFFIKKLYTLFLNAVVYSPLFSNSIINKLDLDAYRIVIIKNIYFYFN